MADALAPMSGQPPPPDPDAQATITDFIDYTEYFPSDLFRSTTLIGKLDENYHSHVAAVHQLTRFYATLPDLPLHKRPDPIALRKDVSSALASALRARESAFAEASRLSTVADNLTNRIATILRKLETLPKPPSRDPTPPPKARSPISQRNRKFDERTTPRIKLKIEAADTAQRSIGRPKKFKRRLIVPGEVLPPFEPGSPDASDESESESERYVTPVPHFREKISKAQKHRTGTNIHSSVAGISVSNAMAQLEPPPPNPQLGSKHAPWLKLTEWELNKIRKRMKKNADWLPSDIMIKRELAAAGRGKANYMAAKAHAAETGGIFLDEEPEDFKRPVNFRNRASEAVLGPGGEEKLINNGMKLNEAKKLKRKLMLEEAAEREEANRRITQAALAVNDLFAPVNGNITGATPTTESKKRHRKRKRLSSPSVGSPSVDFPPDVTESPEFKPKKIRLGSLSAVSRGTSNAFDDPNAQDVSRDPVGGHLTNITTNTRHSRRNDAAKTRPFDENAKQVAATAAIRDSSERSTSQPPTGIKLKLNPTRFSAADQAQGRESASMSLKQKSAQQSSTATPETAAGRRTKRHSNGKQELLRDVTPTSTSSAAIKPIKLHTQGRGRPRKSSTPRAQQPDKPRDKANGNEEVYCLCREAGGGRMIACEDPNCKIEWFHFECVGLNPKDDKRFSRLYWYCPDCRRKHGVAGDGTTTKD